MSATQDFRTVIHAVRKGWRRMQGPMRRRMLLMSGEYIKTTGPNTVRLIHVPPEATRLYFGSGGEIYME